MASLNNVQLIGYLGRDPELKYIQNGTPVCDFSIAITEKYNSESKGKIENTTWVKIVVWNKLAENCNNFLKKGSLVFVNGKIRVNSYTKKDSGNQDIKMFAYEVVANNIQFLDRKDSQQGSGTQNSNQQNQNQSQSPPQEMPDSDFSGEGDFAGDDDIPF